MYILNLSRNSPLQNSNVYLVLGYWNSINGVNTLIDVGCDPCIIHRIINTHTGVERQRIKQVILTHLHSQNHDVLHLIKQKFNPVIYAYDKGIREIDCTLNHGDKLKVGDTVAEIIYIPFHSKKSIGIYLKNERVLFSGDNELFGNNFKNNNIKEQIKLIKENIKKPVKTIYSSYGAPIFLEYQKKIHCLAKSSQNNK